MEKVENIVYYNTKMKYFIPLVLQRIMFVVVITLVTACVSTSTNTIDPLPLIPQERIGVISTIQPMGTTDLLAGYIPEGRGLATEKDIEELNSSIMDMLREKTKREYILIPSADGADPTATRSASRNSALQFWVNVGKKMKVKYLVIPYMISWHPRDGGDYGVVSSAELIMDFFLVDVTQGVVLDRSHYNEKQVPLTENLLDIKTFIARGGKWVTTQELANEAIEKMISDFNLGHVPPVPGNQ